MTITEFHDALAGELSCFEGHLSDKAWLAGWLAGGRE